MKACSLDRERVEGKISFEYSLPYTIKLTMAQVKLYLLKQKTQRYQIVSSRCVSAVNSVSRHAPIHISHLSVHSSEPKSSPSPSYIVAVSPRARVRASVRRSVASTPPVSMSRDVRLPNISLLPALLLVAMEERHHACNEEEYAVHDPKREARLQHRALLVGSKVQRVRSDTAQYAKVDLVGVARCHGRAVLVRYAAQLVYTCDQGADEAEIDEGDEAGVGFRAVVGEEGADCPGAGKDGDDEEDEDVGWCEGIVTGVDVDEVGQHAESGDLGGCYLLI